ncbi:MAG: pyridoxamine 5'-phosphate oxidase family protein, partial [Alcanivoracaceae bacterium]
VEGVSFGGLFIVSGMEETLRVNGRVSGISGDTAVVAVEECYLHCAKSFRRSGFWQAAPREAMGEDSATFVGQATFLALATINSKGQVDVSPKGDPAGILIQAYEAGYCFADRPGNKRIDSFRNLIEQPAASIIAIVPGSEAVLEIQGTATLGTDADLLPRFAVQGKTPKLVTKVAAESTTVRNSPAIAASALWPAQPAPDDLNPSAIFKAHIRKSKESSLKAKVARAAVSVPGAFEAGLQADYKKNMY